MNRKLASCITIKLKIYIVRAEWLVANHCDETFRLWWSSIHHPAEGYDAPIWCYVCEFWAVSISYNTTCPTARATKIRQFKDCFSCFYINGDSNPSQKLNGVAINHLKFVLLEIFPTWNITFDISSNTFVIDGSIVIWELHNQPITHIRRNAQVGKIFASLGIF